MLRPLRLLTVASPLLMVACAAAPPTTGPAPAATGGSATRAADTKQEFDRLNTKYFYTLGDKPFTAIDCGIDSATLDGVMAQLHKSLDRLGDKVKVTDTLPSYHLNYRRTGGPSITDPQISIEFNGPLKDPQKAEAGRKEIIEGFDKFVSMIDTQLKNMLDMLSTANSAGSSQITMVRETPDGFVAHYQDPKLGPTDMELKGHVATLRSTAPQDDPHGGLTMTMTLVDAVDHKLIPAQMIVDMPQEGKTTHGQIDLSYQDMGGGVQFPARLGINASSGVPSVAMQQVQIQVELHSCKLTK